MIYYKNTDTKGAYTMKQKKQWACLLLAGILAVSLTACGTAADGDALVAAAGRSCKT